MTTSPIRKIVIGAAICATCCICSMLYYISCGWSLVDAAYMTVITIYGVGYGEVHPLETSESKLATMALILVGCTSGIYVVGGFVQMVAEGEIHRLIGEHKTMRAFSRMKNHTIVCGFGRIGRSLAEELKAEKKEFLIVEANETELAKAEALGYSAILGDATTEETLEQAGVRRASTLLCVVDDDAANVFITLTARDLNSRLDIIARAHNQSTEGKLLRSGANSVVIPAQLGANRMLELIHDSEESCGKNQESKLDRYLTANNSDTEAVFNAAALPGVCDDVGINVEAMDAPIGNALQAAKAASE